MTTDLTPVEGDNNSELDNAIFEFWQVSSADDVFGDVDTTRIKRAIEAYAQSQVTAAFDKMVAHIDLNYYLRYDGNSEAMNPQESGEENIAYLVTDYIAKLKEQP